jgi:ketosteroid isomerase-like protein
MNHDEKRELVELYIDAYNAFNTDGMLAVIHPDIDFKNVAGGKVNAAACGKDQLRHLAEQSRGLFTYRKQTVTQFEAKGDQAFVEVDYIGVLATDLPNGMRKGETFRLAGRTEFAFRDGKICKITDIS